MGWNVERWMQTNYRWEWHNLILVRNNKLWGITFCFRFYIRCYSKPSPNLCWVSPYWDRCSQPNCHLTTVLPTTSPPSHNPKLSLNSNCTKLSPNSNCTPNAHSPRPKSPRRSFWNCLKRLLPLSCTSCHFILLNWSPSTMTTLSSRYCGSLRTRMTYRWKNCWWSLISPSSTRLITSLSKLTFLVNSIVGCTWWPNDN